MSRTARRPFAATVLLVVAAALGTTVAPASEATTGTDELTVEWIFGDDGERYAARPSFAWTDDGDLLLYDATRPEADRTIERIDVDTGRRTAAVDAAKAIASLAALRGPTGDDDDDDGNEDDGEAEDDDGEELEWPDHVAPDGTRGVYVVDDDLFVLDFASSAFARLTATPAEESIPRFSPDSGKLAFVRDHDLVVRDLATGEETRLTDDGSDLVLNGTLSYVYFEEIFDRDGRGYWWSPDSKSIAFLRSDDSKVTELVYPHFEPAVPEVIRQRYPKTGGINPDVRLAIVPAAGGSPRFLDRDDTPYEYLVGVTWLPDSSRVAIQTLNRDQTRLDLVFVDRASAKPTRILTERDATWSTQHELQFVDGGKRFVWSSERDGYTHLYLYEADGTLVRRLTEGAWTVRGPQSFYGAPLDSTFVDDANDVVYFTGHRDSPVERHLYRVGLDGAGLARVSEAAGMHTIEFRDDRGAYVDLHSNACTPTVATLRVVGGDRAVRLTSSDPAVLDRHEWRCAEIRTVPGDDGFALPFRLLKPKAFDPQKKYPVILYVYGGPSAPVVENTWAPAGAANAFFEQILLREGYVVANVDPRSASTLGKVHEDPVHRKVWSDLELSDFLAGIRWLKAQPWVDPDRVGMWGWSGGGMSTVLTLTRSTELAAGIAVAPALDWKYYDTKFTEAYMDAPADNPDGYEHTSLTARAGDLSGRLFLVHGTYDDNVHPQHAWALVDALVEAGKPFDLMIYPMRKHGIRDEEARVHLYRAMLAFWQRWL